MVEREPGVLGRCIDNQIKRVGRQGMYGEGVIWECAQAG